MADFADFGASLQPMVRGAWQQRVSLLKTQQSMLHAFHAVYDMYSHMNTVDTEANIDRKEFAEGLADYAGDEGFLLKQQEDFTFAYRDNVKEVCRIYLNAGTLADRLTVAYQLMRQLKHLKRNAFQFKVLHTHQNRADNVVIYATQDDVAAIKGIVRNFDWETCLRPEIPGGTEYLRDGIGWAEQPGGREKEFLLNVKSLFKEKNIPRDDAGVSFGGAMAACVVLGLRSAMPVDGEWKGPQHRSQYCDAVINQLKRIGVDPAKPHTAIQLDKEEMVRQMRQYYATKHPDMSIASLSVDELFREAAKMHARGKLT